MYCNDCGWLLSSCHHTTAQALVQVRGLLDKERLWVPTEASGGLGTAPSGLHVLLQGIEPPATDVTKTVNVAVEAYVQFCHHRIIQVYSALCHECHTSACLQWYCCVW